MRQIMHPRARLGTDEKTALRFWDVVTQYFSSLGTKAEWRLMLRSGHREPVAVIVRVKANEDPDSDR
jgi:hypothetical protein